MTYIYNTKYFHDNALYTLRPKRKALWVHICSDGTIVGFFQGNRGLYKDLDFQIKVLLQGADKRIFTPAHWDWVVDLLIKSHFFPQEVSEILDYYINFYDNICIPFSTQAERDRHKLKTERYISTRYSNVVVNRTLPVDAIAVLLELFCYCEKRNQPIAHQFRDTLFRMKDYCNGLIDIVNVMHLVCSHF